MSGVVFTGTNIGKEPQSKKTRFIGSPLLVTKRAKFPDIFDNQFLDYTVPLPVSDAENVEYNEETALPDLITNETEKVKAVRTLSARSKSKIRNKLNAWFLAEERNLTFVTLTFGHDVTDETAQKVLNNWLTYVRISQPFKNWYGNPETFNYLWVAERQEGKRTDNNIGTGRLHYHIICNTYWDIKKAQRAWISAQKSFGIIPTNGEKNSGFDVKAVTLVKYNKDGSIYRNTKNLVNYLTKYVTKNDTGVQGLVWHCSRGVSNLLTGMIPSQSDFEVYNRETETLPKFRTEKRKNKQGKQIIIKHEIRQNFIQVNDYVTIKTHGDLYHYQETFILLNEINKLVLREAFNEVKFIIEQITENYQGKDSFLSFCELLEDCRKIMLTEGATTVYNCIHSYMNQFVTSST